MTTLSFASLANCPDALPVLADWFQTEWPDVYTEGVATAHFRAEMNRDELPMALVALLDETPIGTVAVRESGPRPGVGPWLGGLYVHPEVRRREIGTHLVRIAASLAWELGHQELFVATELDGFFDGLGFEPSPGAESLRVLRLTRPPTLYEQLGGEAGVRRLVDRFYDHMDEREDAAEVRAMHARSLKSSRDKLFKFLSGWTGGPNLYIEEYGHPRLRGRHLPFSIGTNARDQWLACMELALGETVDDEGLRRELGHSFAGIANHMRNREGE